MWLQSALSVHAAPYDPRYISDQNKSVLWKNPPQSLGYEKANPKWYDLIETWAKSDGSGDNFVSGEYLVNVNMDNLHGAIQLYANPDFLQTYDDKLRLFNGPEAARNSAGTIDRCGWPNKTASEAEPKLQYYRSTAPLVEDFSEGLKPSSFYVAKVKGCCDEDKYNKTNKFGKNINVIKDTVNGVEKNVLALTAWNEDSPMLVLDLLAIKTLHRTALSSAPTYTAVAAMRSSPTWPTRAVWCGQFGRSTTKSTCRMTAPNTFAGAKICPIGKSKSKTNASSGLMGRPGRASTKIYATTIRTVGILRHDHHPH